MEDVLNVFIVAALGASLFMSGCIGGIDKTSNEVCRSVCQKSSAKVLSRECFCREGEGPWIPKLKW